MSREELIGLGEGLPFELVIGEVVQYPKIDPDWEEPDGFDWESGEAPVIGYYDAFSVGWKWEHKGKRYGNFFYVDCGTSPNQIIENLIENFEHCKDVIKGGTWTAQ